MFKYNTTETNCLTIRNESIEDHRTVENLVRESFWNVYRPGCYEHYLLHVMRNHKDFVPELDFVMEKDGQIIGQMVFVKAEIKADDGSVIPILTMGPICIAPQYKRKGYGLILLNYGMQKAKEWGVGAVFFEGNIEFYGKGGFVYASDYGIRYSGVPDGEDTSFFLGKELKSGYLNGVTGEYSTPKVYFVADKDIENFDKTFPEKQKLKLPGQLF